jgi:hypothetical protein
MSIKNNTTSLQELLEMVNNLPNAGGSDPVLQDKTITPTTSTQTVTADSGYDGLDTVTVAAIPNTYVKPTTTKAATTYTPTTSNQTIAAGTYCSGAQTIKGDANLKAENIAEGVSIFGVTGTHSGGGSGGGVEYEIVTITESSSTIPFTLARVTNTFGLYNGTTFVGGQTQICGHIDTLRLMVMYQGSAKCAVVDGQLFLEGQALTAGLNFVAPYTAVFINDPSKEAIYG